MTGTRTVAIKNQHFRERISFMEKGGASWRHAREEKEEIGRGVKSSGGRMVC